MAVHDDEEDGDLMGFFNKPDALPAEPGGLAPLSDARIKAVLDARGYNYGVDGDGDIGGIWDDHLFYFLRIGSEQEHLQVRGRWSRPLSAAHYTAVLELANEWNINKLFPKTYVRVEDGDLGVYAEHTVDYEPGLTDEQLDQHLACGVSTALSFFGLLDERFPEAVEQFRAMDAARREQE